MTWMNDPMTDGKINIGPVIKKKKKHDYAIMNKNMKIERMHSMVQRL